MSKAQTHYSVMRRKLDFEDFSFKFIFSLGIAAFAVYAMLSLLKLQALDTSLAIGLNATLAAVLAWMLGREIEPERKVVANLSALAATVLFYFALPNGQLLTLEILIVALCMRMISRPTGFKFTCWDLTIIWALLLLSAFLTGSWMLVIFVGIAYAIDWLIPEGNKIAAIFMIGTILLTLWIMGWKGVESWHVEANLVLWLAVALLVIAYIASIFIGMQRVRAKADRTYVTLDWKRVFEARIWLVWTSIVLSLNIKLQGINGFWILWLVMAVFVFYKLVGFLTRLRHSSKHK